MNNDSLDNQIHDYLSGIMDIATRKDFESQLSSDPDMAERVRFERELYNAIGSSTENDLRANLQQIARRLEQTDAITPVYRQGRSYPSRRWLIFSVLALVVALIWWSTQYRMEPKSTPAPVSEPVPSIPTTPAENAPPTQDAPPQQAVQKSRPVAASYEPIPALETYVGSQFRSQDWKISVQEPARNATLSAKNGRAAFRFAGNIQGSQVSESVLRVLIFNNSRPAFESMKPLSSEPLKIAPDGNFLLEKSLLFKTGLYYYLIEDEESGNWLFVGKFMM